MDINAERRVPIYKLLQYKAILMQLLSFSDNIAKCNFTARTGWGGKTYAHEHDVDEYKPALRGVEILDIYYLKLTDTCVLTEEQYKDYKIIAGFD